VINVDRYNISVLNDKVYNKQIAIFLFVLFILLSVCSPGIFLNDEWVFTNQLSQLSDGGDLIYNDGKYGYFENGDISNYFSVRNNVLVYSLAFPLVATPIHFMFGFISDLTGGDVSLFFNIIYLLSALYLVYFVVARIFKFNVLEYLMTSIAFIGFSIFILTNCNIILFSGAQNIPSEVLSLCFTNILLFSVLSVVIYNIVVNVIEDKTMQLFTTFAALFTGSLFFWATTCKDHVFVALIIALIVLFIIKSKEDNRYYALSVVFSGLLLWIRPEIGFGIFIANVLYIMFISKSFKKHVAMFGIVYPLSLFPFFINNYIITGNVLKHPFLMGNSQYGETCVSSLGKLVVASNPIGILDPSRIMNCINTFVMPHNGGMNLILPFGVFMIAIFYIRKNIGRNEKILLVFGLCSIIYYTFHIFSGMHMDQGILPDMRYYSQFYIFATIFGLSVLNRSVEFDAKKMIYWLLLSIGLFVPVLLLISNLFIEAFGQSYTGFIQLCNVVSIVIFLLIILSLVSYRNNKENRKYEILIPAMFGLMITLQIILVIVYSDVKMNGYPFLTNVGDFLYGVIFIN